MDIKTDKYSKILKKIKIFVEKNNKLPTHSAIERKDYKDNKEQYEEEAMLGNWINQRKINNMKCLTEKQKELLEIILNKYKRELKRNPEDIAKEIIDYIKKNNKLPHSKTANYKWIMKHKKNNFLLLENAELKKELIKIIKEVKIKNNNQVK